MIITPIIKGYQKIHRVSPQNPDLPAVAQYAQDHAFQ